MVVFDEDTADRLVVAAAPRRARQGHRLHRGLRARARPAVRAAGGRVAIAGDPKDHATRDLIAQHPRSGSGPLADGAADRAGQALRRWATSSTRCPLAATLRARVPGRVELTWIVERARRAILREHPALDDVIVGGHARLAAARPAPGRWRRRCARCARCGARLARRAVRRRRSTRRDSSRAGCSSPPRGAPRAGRLRARPSPASRSQRAVHQPARHAATDGDARGRPVPGPAGRRSASPGAGPSSRCPRRRPPSARRRMAGRASGIKPRRPAGGRSTPAPGAPDKRWPVAHFATLARAARATRLAHTRVITWGPGEERSGPRHRERGLPDRASCWRRPPISTSCSRCSAAPAWSSPRTPGRCTWPPRSARPALGLYGPTRRRAQRPVRSAPPRRSERRRDHGRRWRRDGRAAASCWSCSGERDRVSCSVVVVTLERGGAPPRVPGERGVGRRDDRGGRRVAPTRPSRIAREFTDRVFVRPWPGFAAQKNFAHRAGARASGSSRSTPTSACRPALREDIAATLAGDAGGADDGYSVPRRNVFWGALGPSRRPLSRLAAPAVPPRARPLRGARGARVGASSTERVGRLRGACSSTAAIATSRTSSSARIATRRWPRRTGWRGGRGSRPFADLIVRPLGRFLAMYVVRGGFLDGWRGIRAGRALRLLRVPAYRPRSGRRAGRRGA